jgi:O-antigen/teichoic acid export membrane protein
LQRLQFLTQFLDHPTLLNVATLLALCLVALAGCYLLSRIDLAVLVVVALFLQLFSGNWSLVGISLPLDRAMLVVALLVLVLRGARWVTARRLVLRPLHVAFFCAAAWAVASGIIAGTITSHLGFYALLDRFGLVPFALFILAPLIFGSARQRNILLLGLVVIGLYLGGIGVLEGVHAYRFIFPSYIADPSVGIQWGRARGPFLESTGDGFCILCGMVAAAIALTTWRSQWARGVCYLTFVLGGAALFFTLTRSVWIGAFVGFVGAMLLAKKTRMILIPLLAVGALCVVTTLVVSPKIRAEALGRTESQSPVWDRENTDIAALKIISEHPLTGVGFENFINVSAQYMRQQPDYPITGVGLEVHNVFLGHAAELGLPGLLLWLLAFGGAVWRAFSPFPWSRSRPGARSSRAPPEDWVWRDPWRMGGVAIVLCFLVIANLAPFTEALPNALLWTFLGVLAVPYTSELRSAVSYRHERVPVGFGPRREPATLPVRLPAMAGTNLEARLLSGDRLSGDHAIAAGQGVWTDPTESTGIPGTATPLEATGVSVPGPIPPTTGRDQKPQGLRGVARGFSWGTAGQLIGVAGNLALTPFIIHGLGVERYGIFVLVVTLTGMLNSFDGGVMGAAQRYFSIYAGTDDRKSTTQLLVTFCLLLTGLGIIISTAAWFLSPVVVGFLNMSAIWRPQAIFLFRTLGILVTTLFIHTLFQFVLNSRQRYAWTSVASLANYAFYVVGFVIVIEAGRGLRGVAFIFIGQQLLASALIIPVAARYLDRRGISLVPWTKLRSIMSFSGKMQVGGITALVITEVDSLVIGGALSVRALGIYSPGANFANQLSSVAGNGLGPAAIHLGTVYGREGEEGTFREFKRLQRMWVVAVTGWTMVAMASAYFGILAWLGPRFSLSGWICIMLTAGAAVPLVTGLIGTYAAAVGKAGALARYGVVSMVINIALTVPLVLLGTLGVVAATAIGQLAAGVYMLHDVRRSVRSDLPNPLRYVPLLRGVVAAAITIGLEVAIRPYLPAGPVGLIGAGVPALVGLGLFGVLVLGPRQSLRIAARPRSAISELGHWANLPEEPSTGANDADEYQPRHAEVQLASVPEVRSHS